MNELHRLLQLFRPKTAWMALAVALALVTVLANAALLALAGWFIAAMGLAGVAGASMNYFTPAAMIRALAIVRTGGRYAERVVGHDATLRLVAELRCWLYQRLEPLAPMGLHLFRSGDLLVRMRTDIERLDLAFLRLVVPAFVSVAATLTIVIALAHFDGRLAWIESVLAICAGVGIPILMARLGASSSKSIVQDSAIHGSLLVDTIEGIAELTTHGRLDQQAERLTRKADEIMAHDLHQQRCSAASRAALVLLANLALLCALVIAIPLIAAHRIAPAELPLLALLAFAGFDALSPLPGAAQSLAGTLTSARRLFAIADAPSTIREPETPKPLPATWELAFENVALTYPGARRPALTGIDIRLAPGRRIAIVGASGSGKSSIIALALRFLDPCRGRMTLGGVPLLELESEAIRSLFAVVPQQTHLFAATIRDNVRLARPNASDSELEDVCRMAQIHDFIVGQPDGYATYIGANGSKLSGGQARRLAIARALLKRAPVLLLDEPTEGVDIETEYQVLDAILTCRPNQAILLITHRPALIGRMDEIIVIDNGHIIERGKPTELAHLRDL